MRARSLPVEARKDQQGASRRAAYPAFYARGEPSVPAGRAARDRLDRSRFGEGTRLDDRARKVADQAEEYFARDMHGHGFARAAWPLYEPAQAQRATPLHDQL